MVTAQQPRHPLTCEQAGADLPSVGVYGFFWDAGRTYCVAPTEDADGTDVPCLRIGALHVGQAREDVEERLGSPWQTVASRAPGLTAAVYLLFRDSVAGRGAYYVIEYERVEARDVAFSVQLTGQRPDGIHHFSCLRLEDEVGAVRRQLGEPVDVSPFAAPESGVSGLTWSYEPLPVSIEIVDGKVYSLRVWRPPHVAPRERTLSLLRKR